MIEIRPQQIWRDLDQRSSYDVMPDGTFPVPSDYVGPFDSRPRLVVVEDVDETHVTVRSLHNDRVARVKVEFFHEDERTKYGQKRAQGFAPHPDMDVA